MKKYIFLIIAVLLAGCKTIQQVPIQSTTEIKDTVTITEDPVWTIPSEAYWQMVFECDSNLNVVLADYESDIYGMNEKVRIEREKAAKEKEGRDQTEKQLAKEKKRNRRMMVYISARVDSNEIKNTTIERLRKELRDKEVPVEVPGPEVVKNSHFANFTIWFFWIAVIVGVCYVAVKFKIWRLFK